FHRDVISIAVFVVGRRDRDRNPGDAVSSPAARFVVPAAVLKMIDGLGTVVGDTFWAPSNERVENASVAFSRARTRSTTVSADRRPLRMSYTRRSGLGPTRSILSLAKTVAGSRADAARNVI